MKSTSSEEVSIHAVSPLLRLETTSATASAARRRVGGGVLRQGRRRRAAASGERDPGKLASHSHRLVPWVMVSGRRFAHRASSPVSPVRTRIACSTGGRRSCRRRSFRSWRWWRGSRPPRADGVGHHQLELDLGHEVHDVLRAPIDFGMPRLPPVSLHLGHHQALHAERGQRFANLLQLEWLDHGNDQFHVAPRPLRLRDAVRVAG